MKKLVSILFIFILTNTVTAQIDSVATDSCNIYKNEIGINLIPATAPLMIGNGDYYNIAVNYKKYMKNNGALRFRVNYTPGYSYHHIPPFENSSVISKNDTLTKVFDFTVDPVSFGFSAGYEKQRKGRWTSDFYGIDANFNINKTEYSSDMREYLHDTVLIKTNIDTKQTDIFRIGFNVFYGLKIPVAKQFALSIQFGADFGYYFGDFAYPKEDFYIEQRRIESFNLKKYFVNDFSLVFCF